MGCCKVLGDTDRPPGQGYRIVGSRGLCLPERLEKLRAGYGSVDGETVLAQHAGNGSKSQVKASLGYIKPCLRKKMPNFTCMFDYLSTTG